MSTFSLPWVSSWLGSSSPWRQAGEVSRKRPSPPPTFHGPLLPRGQNGSVHTHYIQGQTPPSISSLYKASHQGATSLSSWSSAGVEQDFAPLSVTSLISFVGGGRPGGGGVPIHGPAPVSSSPPPVSMMDFVKDPEGHCQTPVWVFSL